MNIDLTKFKQKAEKIIAEERFERTQQKIVAFVLDSKGRVLSTGVNSYVKTHPEQAKAAEEIGQEYKVYLHAEVAALTRLHRKQLGQQNTIVVLRLNNQNEMSNAKPCRICNAVIKEKYGINNVIHT
jgi:deoxycytidylate deaminase